MLDLMFITNNPEVALIAEEAGVDRIWVDLEYIGKSERQAGLDTVKSEHSLEDITRIKQVLTTSELMVRVNPIHEDSKKEIEEVITRGADYIMLPMYRTKKDVETFLNLVNKRAKTMLLLETIEAEQNLDEYLDIIGIDEIHIGLNDLHLEKKKLFMFELLIDGTVENLSKKMVKRNLKFGFGGFARVGHGLLPAERIITEHYRLESSMAILSRGFCDINVCSCPSAKKSEFIKGVQDIRKLELEVVKYGSFEYKKNQKEVERIVKGIVNGK